MASRGGSRPTPPRTKREREPSSEPVTRIPRAAAGQNVEVIVGRTPFYAESGGQVGDIGAMTSGSTRVRVNDTQRPYGDLVVHVATVEEGGLAEASPLMVVPLSITAVGSVGLFIFAPQLRELLLPVVGG